ncbi:hypothetical protein ABNQ39_36795 (plasmid) [Azospirillum sp. A26]|uniref:hypothetical protein n=1 Tax=Azospirillum sp. A26 TaxID=3160607 RepID=UPI003671E7C2
MSGAENELSVGSPSARKGIAAIALQFGGWLLPLVLIAWIVATGLGIIGRPQAPRLFGFGEQHAAAFDFSPEVEKQLQEARVRMDAVNRSYNTLRWLTDLATWASFCATAIITLITGGFNLPWPGGAAKARDKAVRSGGGGQRRPGRFHALGFLAAVASVCTLLGAQLGTKTSATLACAKEMRDRITEVAQSLKDVPQNEIVLLTRLRDSTSRDCS